jgi:C4-dicarboxylate-specific signal transduction histidine kinase
VRETAARLESQMRRQGVALQVRLPGSAVALSGAEDWLKQALLNIAVCRLEAMSGEGRLSIECGAQERTATVLMEDDGPGIPEQTLDALYRVSFMPEEGWAATSLHVARVVVESLGGEFRVEKEGARSTCFRLLLPRG